MLDRTKSLLTPQELADIADAVDAELSIYADDDPDVLPDYVAYDLLDNDPNPCPRNPGGHVCLTCCGVTTCFFCEKVVG